MTTYFIHENQKNLDSLTNELRIPIGDQSKQNLKQMDLLIPWGTNLANNQHFFTLNKKANQISGDKHAVIRQYEIFNLQGVTTPITVDPLSKQLRLKKVRFNNIYQVPVFQQKVLSYFKQRKNSNNNWINKDIFTENKGYIFDELTSLKTKKEERRVRQLAIRAIYALNLDFGLVTIGVSSGEKPWVLQVEPFPILSRRLGTLFGKAIQSFGNRWEKEIREWNPTVVLGADPEFVLRRPDGKLELASKYLGKKGPVGCDDIWTNRDRSQLPLAELRPSPTAGPRQLTINLYKTLILASKKITNREVQWLAGALPIEGFPIGGHIHFSRIWLNSFLLRSFDNYLTLMITLFEDPVGIKRRPKYGFLGDFRGQFHGGFEYRTLPSWLVSPVLTKGIFALAKLIAENYIFLYQNPLEDLHLQVAYYKGNKEALRPVVKNLWSEIKQLREYSLYKEYLDPLEGLMNQNYQWNEQSDIRRIWKLPPYHSKSAKRASSTR